MQEILAYGRHGLPLALDGLNATVLRPRLEAGLVDEKSSFFHAVRAPWATQPLRALLHSGEKVAVVIADGTRPLPSERLLPWLFAEIDHLSPADIVIIVGTGSHRANTVTELASMCGPDIVSRYRIINHNAHDPATQALAGHSPYGYPVTMNREYVQADRRILLGFIEPHFMAGFSGGFKAVFPGVAGIDAIMHYHGVDNIGHPQSTWGILEENPTQATIRANGSLLPVDFLVNVTLNRHRQITQYFCGEVLAAHRAGCAHSRASVMIPVPHRYPIVVTTNGGFPLDQNLYQAVKGMSAAAQIVEPGGLILCAALCNDGFPEHGNFRALLASQSSPSALLQAIHAPGFRQFDQWQVQLLALILQKARVGVYSEISADALRAAHLLPVSDLRQAVEAELRRRDDPNLPVAILPEGPMTIPYLA